MDYESLKTLESVIRNQNFERAAKELFITQPAITQRINQLESSYGKRLLIRELPYRATELGEKLLSHYRQVLSLEQALDVTPQILEEKKSSIRLAMNVDSLEIWFRKVLHNKDLARDLNLDISVDDEKYTIDYLKSGKVDVSIGSVKTTVSNHDCIFLGSMTYVLVGNPEFKKKYASRGMSGFDFSKVPAIIFNERDDLHNQYLKKNFQYSGSFPKTTIPSVHGTKAALLSGFGYALQPLMDIQKELKSKELVLLDNANTFQRDLFLHHWNYLTPNLKKLIAVTMKAAESIV